MESFSYWTPTEIIFGRGAEEKTPEEIRKSGGSRIFLLAGGKSAAASGLLDRILSSLKQEGLTVCVKSGVQPNPRLSFARQAVREAAAFEADFVLAVGGGSVIDTAKAVAHGAANPDVDLWRFWSREIPLEKSLPIGVVLTISAAGSETSDSAVLTNEEERCKRGLNTPFNRPRFAVMNPELTFTLPKFQIACGIVDIFMHTLDRYFSAGEANETTDAMAEALLRTVAKNGPAALDDPTNYHAMSELMWCGSLSHNGLTGLGRPMDFSNHQLGHELSAKFDVTHGASLSAVWGAWASVCLPANPKRFARLGETVWGIRGSSVEDGAKKAVARTVSFFSSLGMPTCFSELGVGIQPEEVLRDLADRCAWHGKRKVGVFRPLSAEDLLEIYRLANH